MFFGGGHRDNNSNSGMGVIGTLLMVILAPLAAMLVQMAISRTPRICSRQHGSADQRKSRGIAAALAKIDAGAHAIENVPAEHNPAAAPLFIINPLSGARMDNLFATHPATQNRIAALQQLARGNGPRLFVPAARFACRRWSVATTESLGLDQAATAVS